MSSTLQRGPAGWAPLVAAGFVILAWGLTPAITQVAAREIDAATVGMLRTVIPALLLVPYMAMTVSRLPRHRRGWIAMIVSALGSFVGFSVLFSFGIPLTSTAHAALIIAAAPVFTGLFGFLIDRAWPRYWWWIGAAVALVGEAVLIGSHAGGEGLASGGIVGDLIVLGATLCVSTGYVAGGRLSREIGTWPATSWAIGIGGVILAPFLFAARDATAWSAISLSGWSAMLYLSVVSSIVAYALWTWAIGRAGVARIAPLQFAQPVVSLVVAVLVLAEPMTWPIVVATACVLAGIAIARKG